MTMAASTTAVNHAPMDSTRRTALVAGIFYLLTFVSSIPALILLNPILNNADYIVSAGADTRVLWGCLLDTVNAFAAIGTAVTLFPVVRRQHEASALGFVTSRLVEAAVILIGVMSLLAVVTLRQHATGADSATLLVTGKALVDVRNWTFLFGPGLMPAFNALLLGSLMLRSRLVPRIIPTVGLIGAPLQLASFVTTVFGYTDQVSGWAVLTVPVALWELSVGVYMIVRGFRPAAVAELNA